MMDKHNAVYPYNGILFSIKKEGNAITHHSMEETWGLYSEWNKPIAKR